MAGEDAESSGGCNIQPENSKGCEAQPVVPGPSCHALHFAQCHQGLEEGRANNSYGRDDMPKIRHHGHAFSNDLRRNKEAGRNKLAALPSKSLQIEHVSQKWEPVLGQRHA
jgi:hypothetical protein